MGSGGFTLMEVMIAVFLLAVALGGLAAVAATVVRGNAFSQTLTTATTLARDKMEELKSTSYANMLSGGDTKSADSINYTRAWIVGAEAGNRRTVTVTVTWTWLNMSRSVTLNSLRAKNN